MEVWNAILLFVLAGIFMVPGPAFLYTWYSLSHLVTEHGHPNKQNAAGAEERRG
jgi:hypothetical protein